MIEINTRDKLIYATIELVNEFGLHNTPTSKIAKKAGFSEATIYKHFSNKDELIIATYLKIKSNLAKEVFRGTESIIDVREKSKKILYNYLNYFLINIDQLKYYLQFTNSNYIDQVTSKRGKKQVEVLTQYIIENTKNKYLKDIPIALYYAFVHVPILEIARTTIAGELVLTEELKEQVILNILSFIFVD
ncbi:TetR/AcrR family transcriptional regulator [Wukongibacter baidiensis]|uniref:TetR/AcrR family transcriptional regulator n=1 Tax=Wukongibacter baidiensis TaxID=1723361 RepID=UPI003D7FEBA0